MDSVRRVGFGEIEGTAHPVDGKSPLPVTERKKPVKQKREGEGRGRTEERAFARAGRVYVGMNCLPDKQEAHCQPRSTVVLDSDDVASRHSRERVWTNGSRDRVAGKAALESRVSKPTGYRLQQSFLQPRFHRDIALKKDRFDQDAETWIRPLTADQTTMQVRAVCSDCSRFALIGKIEAVTRMRTMTITCCEFPDQLFTA